MSTSATDFSAPIFLDESEAPTIDTGTAGFDLNDPNLLGGELETKADVDAYATPPPIPDGRYRLKVKQIDVKDANSQPARYAIKQRKNKDGSPMFDNNKPVCYAFSALEGTVIDPGGKYDGTKISDYFVSTLANKKTGGIPIVRVLTVLGVKLPERSTAQSLIQLYLDTLAKEPELEVDVAWEGSMSQDDQKLWDDNPATKGKYAPSVRGMHRFPMSADGKHRLPDLTVKTVEMGEVNLHAQPRIIGYFPVGSAKI